MLPFIGCGLRTRERGSSAICIMSFWIDQSWSELATIWRHVLDHNVTLARCFMQDREAARNSLMSPSYTIDAGREAFGCFKERMNGQPTAIEHIPLVFASEFWLWQVASTPFLAQTKCHAMLQAVIPCVSPNTRDSCCCGYQWIVPQWLMLKPQSMSVVWGNHKQMAGVHNEYIALFPAAMKTCACLMMYKARTITIQFIYIQADETGVVIQHVCRIRHPSIAESSLTKGQGYMHDCTQQYYYAKTSTLHCTFHGYRIEQSSWIAKPCDGLSNPGIVEAGK